MGFAAAEVNVADLFIRLHLVELAFTQYGPLVENRYLSVAGNLFHESHIVLDDDDAVFFREADQQLACARGFWRGRRALFRLDARLLDDLAPLSHLGHDPLAELVRGF